MLYPTPEELGYGNFFANKDNVVASFISSGYYESFMQVLEALFHAFVVKNGLWLRETKPLTFERTALTDSSRTVCGT